MGRAGTAGRLLKGLLEGVPGDMSEFSSKLVMDMFLLLKLDDEKFFLNFCTFGDADRAVESSFSIRPRWPKGDISVRASDPSVGLASINGGDDGRRVALADRAPAAGRKAGSVVFIGADFACAISSAWL